MEVTKNFMTWNYTTKNATKYASKSNFQAIPIFQVNGAVCAMLNLIRQLMRYNTTKEKSIFHAAMTITMDR